MGVPKSQSWINATAYDTLSRVTLLSDSQLSRVTKENLISSPKKIIQDNNSVFLNDQYGTAIKNDSFTPDEFYENLKTISQLTTYMFI